MSPVQGGMRSFLLLCVAVPLSLVTGCVPSSAPGRSVGQGDSTSQANGAAPIVGGDVSGGSAAPPSAPALAEAPPTPPSPAPVARPVFLPRPAGPYRVHIVDEAHRDLPTFWKDGREYVMGSVGSRYSIALSNPTSRRVEAVVSVDGLDAIDGRAASYVDKRGYILPAYGDMTIDGFRTSFDEVATFRFSSVSDSYAGRKGDARDVGVIGVAFFTERPEPPSPPPPLATDYPPPSSRGFPARRIAPSHASNDDLGGPSGGGGLPPPGATPSSPAATRAAVAPGFDKAARVPSERPGLGTEFGEARASHVDATPFERANPRTPSELVAIRYNNRSGLLALGLPVPTPYASAEDDLRLRESASPFRETQFSQPPP